MWIWKVQLSVILYWELESRGNVGAASPAVVPLLCNSPWSMGTTRCCSLDEWFRVTASSSVISTSDGLWVTMAIMQLQHPCVLQRVSVMIWWTRPRRSSVFSGSGAESEPAVDWNALIESRCGSAWGGGSPARPLTRFQQCQESWSWLTATVHQCFF